MFPTLEMFGVGSIPWSPLARGLVTRPLGGETKRGGTDRMIKGYQNFDVVPRVEEIAKTRGVSMAQVALAWVLAKPGVSAPIVGTTSLQNLDDLCEGVHLKLTEEEIKSLEEPYKTQSVFGHS